MNNKVVIIGCGNVGMSYAYALLNQRTNVNELVLIDINKDRIDGEVMDLNHSLAFAPSKIKIKSGDYSDCKDATIILLAAGANQEEGEKRIDLIHKNNDIFKSIIESVNKTGFNGIYLIATNPLDIMTYITREYSNLPYNRVIGSGTSLDTARLKYIISSKLEINAKNIHGYVIGEHGDTEFVPWSLVKVGMQDIKDFLNEEEMKKVEEEVRDSAYEIIKRKGATYYGIGMCLVRITNAILSDEDSILTVSVYDENNKVYVGLPAVVNRSGIKKRVIIDLSEEEENKLRRSIDYIKENINKL